MSIKFPIILLEEGTVIPDERCYVLTSKGLFFQQINKAGKKLVPVEHGVGVPHLAEPDISLRLNGLPKIPALIIAQALCFFRKIYNTMNSESYVTLLYSKQLNEFQLWCPTQTVSHGSVNYDRTDLPPIEDRKEGGWQMVGTIHSHCNFSAFHSGTDTSDESTFDGVHITLGHVDRKTISVASSIAMSNQREELKPEAVAYGLVSVKSEPKPQPSKVSRLFGSGSYFGGANSTSIYASHADYYDLELDAEEEEFMIQADEFIEQNWLPKVSKATFGYKSGKGSNRGGKSWWENFSSGGHNAWDAEDGYGDSYEELPGIPVEPTTAEEDADIVTDEKILFGKTSGPSRKPE